MRRAATQDLLLAFGAVMGIVSVWQYLETSKAQKKASGEHQDLIRRLASIEQKLSGSK